MQRPRESKKSGKRRKGIGEKDVPGKDVQEKEENGGTKEERNKGIKDLIKDELKKLGKEVGQDIEKRLKTALEVTVATLKMRQNNSI